MPQHPESKNGILGHFLKWEKTIPDSVFLRQPEGRQWKEHTWKDVGCIARKLTRRLQDLSIPKGSRVALLSQNCAEWIICDMAIMMGGYVSVPLYANINATTFKEVMLHSGTKLLLVGKLFKHDWENIKHEISASLITVTMQGYEKESITSWKTFLGCDEGQANVIVPSLDDILTIIYTSGTTGAPKGVVHTVGSIIKAVETASNIALLNERGNRFFSYLPLSHAAERGLVEFGGIFSGGCISFAESQETFLDNLRNVMPTHFLAVPRIWEKFQLKILEKISQKRINLFLKIPPVAYLLRRRIKAALGLQKAKAIFSGAAYISPELLQWFAVFGIHIREAYGMSENFNVCTLNPREAVRIGTVGRLYDHQEVKIDPDTKEILQRCEWLMKGYYKDPELTSQTIKNGYLHTGDTGELSSDGYLKISGRIKDVFKTSKGEYVNPVETERDFLLMREIDQVCLLGQQYPQPFLAVVLSTYGKSLKKEKLLHALTAALTFCNKNKMGYQNIKMLIIVNEEWTVENNLLTPTLKMKRNALSLKYETILQKHFYSNESVCYE